MQGMVVGLAHSLTKEGTWARSWGTGRWAGAHGEFPGFLYFDSHESYWKETARRHWLRVATPPQSMANFTLRNTSQLALIPTSSGHCCKCWRLGYGKIGIGRSNLGLRIWEEVMSPMKCLPSQKWPSFIPWPPGLLSSSSAQKGKRWEIHCMPDNPCPLRPNLKLPIR